MNALHILFTMDCERVLLKSPPRSVKSWDQSVRSIDAFSTRLLRAGYPPTLFVAPESAQEHGPLFEELIERGAEIGLFLDPPKLRDAAYKRALGRYTAEQQRAIVTFAADSVTDAVGARPRSIRTKDFSASDATFKLLYELGFRQGSLSRPGQNLWRKAGRWDGAPLDPHYVDPANRLEAGTFPFLEVPPTTDPEQHMRHGIPFELRIEMGTFEEWLRPFIEGQLERMEREQVEFRALCIGTHNGVLYDADMRSGVVLEEMLDYFDTLAATYDIVPVTLSSTHERFWQAR